MIQAFLVAFALALGALGGPAAAHESRPAYLEITELDGGRYEVLWKRPALGDRVLALEPRLDPPCAEGASASYAPAGSAVERWTIDCGGDGIAGRELRIDGLETTLTDVLVRIAHRSGVSEQVLLKPGAPSHRIAGTPDRLQVATGYTRLGIEHILSGYDHLLFVLGLMLLVRKLGPLVRTITAFTLAHSLTLALATLGFVRVSPAPVEAAIALSIVYLAAEVIHVRQGRPGLTARYPWLIAFGFGLVHGLGFAGALREVGLPEHEIPTALLFFNVGVELGQLMFVALCLGLLWALRRLAIRLPAWTEVVPVYVMGSIAAFWFVTRTSAILNVT